MTLLPFQAGESIANPDFREKLNAIVGRVQDAPPLPGQQAGKEYAAQQVYFTQRARYDGTTALSAGELIGLINHGAYWQRMR